MFSAISKKNTRPGELEWRSADRLPSSLSIRARSDVEQREGASCLGEITRRLEKWLDVSRLGHFQPIDDFDRWRPCDFWVLRYVLRDQGGADAYHDSMHWKSTRSEQHVLQRACERCGADARHFVVDVHHLHYETLGVERPGIDLVTLCRSCHIDGEHGDYWPGVFRAPTPDGIPF